MKLHQVVRVEIPLNTVEITAPLVGTFYQSAKPGASAFVKEGDNIVIGQTICIIEAMKIFNEIETTFHKNFPLWKNMLQMFKKYFAWNPILKSIESTS